MSQNKSMPRAVTVNNCFKKQGCMNIIDYTQHYGLHYNVKRRGSESFKGFTNAFYKRCYQNCTTQVTKPNYNFHKEGEMGTPSER